MSIATGAKSVLSAQGFGRAIATVALVYVVLVVLNRWQSGRYAPQNL